MFCETVTYFLELVFFYLFLDRTRHFVLDCGVFYSKHNTLVVDDRDTLLTKLCRQIKKVHLEPYLTGYWHGLLNVLIFARLSMPSKNKFLLQIKTKERYTHQALHIRLWLILKVESASDKKCLVAKKQSIFPHL